MDGANFEPDSISTPRVAGVITNPAGKKEPVFYLSIVTNRRPAAAWQMKPKAGMFYGVSTYHGNIENPGAFNIDGGLAELKCEAQTPQEIADFIYNISAETYQGDDIRVCAIGGTRVENNWKTALINRHKG